MVMTLRAFVSKRLTRLSACVDPRSTRTCINHRLFILTNSFPNESSILRKALKHELHWYPLNPPSQQMCSTDPKDGAIDHPNKPDVWSNS